MRLITAGESHGKEIIVTIEGFPANVPIDKEQMLRVLQRRRQALGRGPRMDLEPEIPRVVAGMRNSRTLGSPLAVSLDNAESQKWSSIMDPWQADVSDPVTIPRPGHADFSGAVKYRQQDMRNIAERASARESAARTVAGCFALQLLAALGISVQGDVEQWGEGGEAQQVLESASCQGDTVGGIITVEITGLPGGIGTHVHWDRRLDARLAGAVMAIQAVKGVEFGHAFSDVLLAGSQYHDEFTNRDGKIVRSSNTAGGIEGGMSNGENILIRAAVKPIPTLDRPLDSFERDCGRPCPAPVTRHDISAVGAAAVIAEAVCAWEVACVLVKQFGGDTYQDIRQRFHSYKQRWQEEISCPGE